MVWAETHSVVVDPQTQTRGNTMSKFTAKVEVYGTVWRSVTVSGNSQAELEANAQSEWARVVGGQVGNAQATHMQILEKENSNAKI